MGDYGRDKWLYPFELGSSGNTIVWTDGAGSHTVNLNSATTFYQHNDSSFDSTKSGFLKAFVDALNGNSTDSYTLSAVDSTPPVGSGDDLDKASLRITNGTTTSWTLDFNDGSWSLDPTLLGFSDDQTGQVSSDGSGNIDGEQSLGKVWQSHTLIDGAATRKLGPERASLFSSGDDPRDAYRNAWDRSDVRRIVYEWVPPMVVRATTARANYASDYYGNSGLVSGDDENAFFDVWQSMSKNEEIVIVHDLADDLQVSTNHDPDADGESGYEIVKLWSMEQAQDFGAVASVSRASGELYTIDVEVVQVSGTYEY